jgi:hypothetical protein
VSQARQPVQPEKGGSLSVLAPDWHERASSLMAALLYCECMQSAVRVSSVQGFGLLYFLCTLLDLLCWRMTRLGTSPLRCYSLHSSYVLTAPCHGLYLGTLLAPARTRKHAHARTHARTHARSPSTVHRPHTRRAQLTTCTPSSPAHPPIPHPSPPPRAAHDAIMVMVLYVP